MTDLCLSEVSDGVALLTLNRPDRNNGMTGDLELAYFERLSQAAVNPEVKAIVVTGAGKSFCPGADLANRPGPGEEPLPNSKVPVTFPTTIDKPLIAAINGACAGVGLVQALYCDVRFAAAGAKFTTAFPRRGLIAEYGIAWVLPRVVGRGLALDLLVSARVFTAEEALSMGLVSRVCEPGAVVEEALAYAKDVAANVSPASIGTIKRQVNRYEWMDLDGALADSHELMRLSQQGPDVREGVSSYLEGRPARFAPLGEGTRYPWMERPQRRPSVKGLAPEGLTPAQGYQHVTEAAGGRIVFVAGQVGVDANGVVVGAGDVAVQTAQAFRNLEVALRAAGLEPSDVTRLNYYVVHLDEQRAEQFAAGAAAARADGVRLPKAAATMVGVTALQGPDYLVEIEAVAVR